MFHNYFFLTRLASALHEKLEGLTLVQCFSQNRDELILQFDLSDREFLIRANLDPVISLLDFPTHFARAGRNSVDLFSELIGKKVQQVSAFNYERSFYIQFETDEMLIFKMHARRANILYAENNSTKEIFRKKLSQDMELVPTSLDQEIAITEDTFSGYADHPLTFVPALGKEVKVYFESTKYFKTGQQEQWEIFQDTLDKLAHNPIYLHNTTIPRLSLIETSDHSTLDPIQATVWLYEYTAKKLFFEKEKEQLQSSLQQKIKKSESYIAKNVDKLRELEASRNPEEIANLLMANLHSIQQGLSKVVLTDFYKNEPITIKLNVTLSPQKNAETYYHKAKNRHQELEVIRSNIKEKER